MSQVDQLQNAEEHVNQMREESERAEREARAAELRQAPLTDLGGRARWTVTAPLADVRRMVNMRVGPLPDVHELAVSIREAGVLHPPLVRATGEAETPYELLAGQRRLAAMALIDEVDGPREDWPFTLVEDVSVRDALAMQFAENFHQAKPEPVQFARAARAIMAQDETLTAAEVSRLVGAPVEWTRKALRLLDLPTAIVERVERGDLAFTTADLVRRGIARGDVSEEKATELVEEHAAGNLSGGALKLGVGYVPPKPDNYEEMSRKLDEARWASSRENASREAGADAEQRDWDADDRARERNRGARSAARPGAGPGLADRVAPEDLDAYLIGLVLSRVAPGGQGVVDARRAFDHAFGLLPAERLGALRRLAAELLESDPAPPAQLGLPAAA